MEKYYIVTPESELYSEYTRWRKNTKDVNKVVTIIMDKHGIETTLYVPMNEFLYIKPTENDKQKFMNQLKKPIENDLYAFKKSSIIGKEWVKFLNENNLKVYRQPLIRFYFGVHKGRYRLFDIDDIIYASYESESNFDNPKGFQEIKASEFYRILEENNCK